MGKLIIKNRYGTIPNDLLNSVNISFKAKGLYAYIQSKPDNWEFSAERISKQVKEGLPSVVSALKELENFGYLVRNRYQNNKGFWVVDYLLYEIPNEEILPIGNPTKENPNVGKPTNISNKDFSKKEYNSNNINKEKEEIILTFRDELFNKWVQYKKEKKSKYTPVGIKVLYSTWINKSDEELEKAINHSISNNYQGIYEPKQQSNQNGNSNNTSKGTSTDRIEALRKW
jgi:hypothetical protein